MFCFVTVCVLRKYSKVSDGHNTLRKWRIAQNFLPNWLEHSKPPDRYRNFHDQSCLVFYKAQPIGNISIAIITSIWYTNYIWCVIRYIITDLIICYMGSTGKIHRTLNGTLNTKPWIITLTSGAKTSLNVKYCVHQLYIIN